MNSTGSGRPGWPLRWRRTRTRSPAHVRRPGCLASCNGTRSAVTTLSRPTARSSSTQRIWSRSTRPSGTKADAGSAGGRLNSALKAGRKLRGFPLTGRRARSKALGARARLLAMRYHQGGDTTMSNVWRTLTGSVLTVALVLWALSAGAQQGNEWPIYGADYANTRYSALDQINTKNVRRLRVAWIRSLGTIESQEATPIVVGDTMYVSTSTGPRYVFALSARDGTVKWKYEPELPKDVVATVCSGLDSRGAASANARRFVTRLDAKLVALRSEERRVGKEGRA